MQNSNDLQPLVQYDPVFIISGIALIVATGLYIASVFFFTRKKKVRKISKLALKPAYVPDMVGLRKKYLEQLRLLEREFMTKTITERELHLKLSALLRGFVGEVSGLPARSMTLTDLKRTKFTTVTEAVELFYAIEFAEKTTSDPIKAIAVAREVLER